MAKKTRTTKTTESVRVIGQAPWLFSARVDPWVTHRLSMLLMLTLLGSAWAGAWSFGIDTNFQSFSIFAILQTLINWPHFMVSYKVLYVDHRDLKKHIMAMLYVPLFLVLAWCLAYYWVMTGQVVKANNYSYLIWVIAAFYLAWHYVGQTWGLVSLGLLQSGCSIHASELRVLRGSLKVMVGWHVVWAMQQLGDVPFLVEFKSSAAMTFANGLAVASLLVCLTVFVRIYKRLGYLPEKVWAPLVLLYVWYFTLWVQPVFALFIQLSHALQYLIFPAKIQVAKHLEKFNYGRYTEASIKSPWWRLTLTYVLCVALGWLVFWAPSFWSAGGLSMTVLAGLLGSMVNIHHYYTDGAVWKLRDPRVRNLLLVPIQSQVINSSAKG